MFGAMRLKMIHRELSAGRGPMARDHQDEVSQEYFRMQTCLRLVRLVPADVPGQTPTSADVLGEDQAYERMLEIICGLHSPLVGETEVLGQFKAAIEEQLAKESESPYRSTLAQWAKALLEDAKEIRERHLRDVGSQSYGSLVRRELRALMVSDCTVRVDVVGAGQLAAEILPWTVKAARGENVVVHARRIEQAQVVVASIPGAKVAQLTLGANDGQRSVAHQLEKRNPKQKRVLIVAAPLSAAELREFIADVGPHFHLVLDLRGEAGRDPLHLDAVTRTLALDEIFSSLTDARAKAESRRREALADVRSRVEKRLRATTFRPFGWDDIWS